MPAGMFSTLPREIVYTILFHLLENTKVSIYLKHVYQFFSTCKWALALKADFFYYTQCQLSIHDIRWYQYPFLETSQSLKDAEGVFCRFACAKNSWRNIVDVGLKFQQMYNTLYVKNNYLQLRSACETSCISCTQMEIQMYQSLTLGEYSPMKVLMEMQPLCIEPLYDTVGFYSLFGDSPWKFFFTTYREFVNQKPKRKPVQALNDTMGAIRNHLKLYSDAKKPTDDLENILVQISKVVGEVYCDPSGDSDVLGVIFVIILMVWGLPSYNIVTPIREYFQHFNKFNMNAIHTFFHIEDHLLEFNVSGMSMSDLYVYPFVSTPMHRELFDLFVDNIIGDDFAKFKKLLVEYVAMMREWMDESPGLTPEYASNLTLILNHFQSSWGVQSWQDLLDDNLRIEFIFPTIINEDDDGNHYYIHSLGECEKTSNGRVVRSCGCRDHWMFSTFILDTGIQALVQLPRYESESHSPILHNFAPWAMAHPNSNLITVGDGQSLVACKFKEEHIDEWQEDKEMMISWMKSKGISFV